MTFSPPLMQLGGEDFLRELTEFMLNRIMKADVTQRINAEPHERGDERETYPACYAWIMVRNLSHLHWLNGQSNMQ